MPDRHRPLAAASEHQVVTSAWPTGTQLLADQLDDRGYHSATSTDLAAMPPAIAEYAITAFTRPGGIVLDPDCGSGTTIVEALRVGRHAIGLTSHRRWWRLARTNVTATKARGAPPDGMVLVLNRRATTITAAETAGLTGRVDLLLTTVRPATTPTQAVRRLRGLLAESRPLLRPGGHAVIIVPPTRHPTRYTLLDLPSEILAAGPAAGLAPVARCVALTATPRVTRVAPHTTVEQRCTARHAAGTQISIPAHHTALIFCTDPDVQDGVLALPIPPIPVLPRRRRRTRGARGSSPTPVAQQEAA